jgi:mono/diheme cytochrome c family protein
VVVTLAVLMAGAYSYFAGGFAPVATSAPPMPFEQRLARLALHARIEKEMPKSVPIAADDANYLAGATLYVEHCAPCHGLPGRPETAIAKGEFPRPPQLFRGKGVTDDEAGETYWKTANGIRLTGMPGFSNSLTTTQIWQLSLLLANADKLPASALAVLAPAAEAKEPPQGAPSPGERKTH